MLKKVVNAYFPSFIWKLYLKGILLVIPSISSYHNLFLISPIIFTNNRNFKKLNKCMIHLAKMQLKQIIYIYNVFLVLFFRSCFPRSMSKSLSCKCMVINGQSGYTLLIHCKTDAWGCWYGYLPVIHHDFRLNNIF